MASPFDAESERRACRRNCIGNTLSGHISEKEYDCHRYDGVLSALHAFVCTSFYSIISHEPPVFNRFFHIFKIFLEE